MKKHSIEAAFTQVSLGTIGAGLHFPESPVRPRLSSHTSAVRVRWLHTAQVFPPGKRSHGARHQSFSTGMGHFQMEASLPDFTATNTTNTRGWI